MKNNYIFMSSAVLQRLKYSIYKSLLHNFKILSTQSLIIKRSHGKSKNDNIKAYNLRNKTSR